MQHFFSSKNVSIYQVVDKKPAVLSCFVNFNCKGFIVAFLYYRNNLTVLDVVYVEGIGARELLKVGGRLPGVGGSLRFKVPESTLMDCRRRE